MLLEEEEAEVEEEGSEVVVVDELESNRREALLVGRKVGRAAAPSALDIVRERMLYALCWG